MQPELLFGTAFVLIFYAGVALLLWLSSRGD